MYKKKSNILLYIVLIFTVFISAKSCVGKDADPDAVYSLKKCKFSSYGNKTLEAAAEDSLTDLRWSCSEEPVSFEGGFVYEAILSGYSEEYDLDISVGFTVKIGYTRKKDDPKPVTISIVWIQVDDVYSEEINDISYVMDYIYGN